MPGAWKILSEAWKSMSISLIIRCFNEEESIGRLLERVQKQTTNDIETIVVDSGSTDGTLNVVSAYPVKVLHMARERFSFGRSLNMACNVASGRYLVFASAHVFPVNDGWLQALVEPFSDSKVGLVYGKQRGACDSKYSEKQIFHQWYPEEKTACQGHPFCNNANAAIRKELWQKSKYNENLTGLEDLDWAKRIMEEGYVIAYQPDAEVVHVHNERIRGIYNRYNREAIAMKNILPETRFSLIDFLKLYPLNVVSDCRNAISEGVFLRNAFDIMIFRLMQFWGTYRGYARNGQVPHELKKRFYYPNWKDKGRL
jgi:glycosyltransferase involved in cell wall biosynthesis